MSGKYEDQSPVNLAGSQFFEVSRIGVFEWHELEDGKGEPSQVHLELKIKGAEDTTFVVRFKSPHAVDQLIVALMTHRKAVWG